MLKVALRLLLFSQPETCEPTSTVSLTVLLQLKRHHFYLIAQGLAASHIICSVYNRCEGILTVDTRKRGITGAYADSLSSSHADAGVAFTLSQPKHPPAAGSPSR